MSKKAAGHDAASVSRDAVTALRVIGRFSRGNVRLQKGALLTREQLDERARARAERLVRLKRLYGMRCGD